jgi:hypothetical protein
VVETPGRVGRETLCDRLLLSNRKVQLRVDQRPSTISLLTGQKRSYREVAAYGQSMALLGPRQTVRRTHLRGG